MNKKKEETSSRLVVRETEFSRWVADEKQGSGLSFALMPKSQLELSALPQNEHRDLACENIAFQVLIERTYRRYTKFASSLTPSSIRFVLHQRGEDVSDELDDHDSQGDDHQCPMCSIMEYFHNYLELEGAHTPPQEVETTDEHLQCIREILSQLQGIRINPSSSKRSSESTTKASESPSDEEKATAPKITVNVVVSISKNSTPSSCDEEHWQRMEDFPRT